MRCGVAGYIEYAAKEAILPALALNGQLLNGHPVLVKPSESEKNAAAQLAKTQAAMMAPTVDNSASRVYIGNLHINVRDEDLRDVFSPFGTITEVEMHVDRSGASAGGAGFAFLQYSLADSAQKAIASLNGLELAGLQIKVGPVNPLGGGGGMGAGAMGGQTQAPDGELDDGEGGGLNMSATSRAALMQKLAGRADPMAAAPPPAFAGGSNAIPLGTGGGMGGGATWGGAGGAGVMGGGAVAAAAAAAPVQQQRTIMLRNMFAPEDAKADEDFERDMTEDVSEECAKFGKLVHIKVDKNSLGHIYLKFESVVSGATALNALNGRWFGGKMVSAEFQNEANYNAKFGL
jgi:RNA-binding protein 39